MASMSSFSSKALPDATKLRGGYYTPSPIAEFLVRWAVRQGDRVLEPAAGDGALLAPLAKRGASIDAVEILAGEAEKATRETGIPVVNQDFFSWFGLEKVGEYDAVVSNPPYIRFGNWAHESRDLAMELMRAESLKPSKLTNAWVPFVVAGIRALKSGGRAGLIIPAEVLQVGYATQLRAYLVDNCSQITIVSFRQLVFPGILQEVVLLLATKGPGPADIRTVEVRDASELLALGSLDVGSEDIRAALHDGEKWTKYFLSSAEIELFRSARALQGVATIGNYAKVNVGVVTGRNSFFCMSPNEANVRQLEADVIPIVTRSAQLQGLDFDKEALGRADNGRYATRLLSVGQGTSGKVSAALRRYIKLGEEEGVHLGYKCSIRSRWWEVPSVAVPGAFMLRQVNDRVRLFGNSVGATSTDTVHRVFLEEGISARKLAVAALNSLTVLGAEVLGRSYGGGILELEPSECVSLPVPRVDFVDDRLCEAVEAALLRGSVREAQDLVDASVLVAGLQFSPEDVELLAEAGDRLRARRLGRSSRSPAAQ